MSASRASSPRLSRRRLRTADTDTHTQKQRKRAKEAPRPDGPKVLAPLRVTVSGRGGPLRNMHRCFPDDRLLLVRPTQRAATRAPAPFGNGGGGIGGLLPGVGRSDAGRPSLAATLSTKAQACTQACFSYRTLCSVSSAAARGRSSRAPPAADRAALHAATDPRPKTAGTLTPPEKSAHGGRRRIGSG